EGRSSDAVLLELKALQLRRLDRFQEAISELSRLQALLEGQLLAVTPVQQDDRQNALVQLLRIVRYQGEMDHHSGAHGSANGKLLALVQNAAVAPVFRMHLEYQDLLERAHYLQVHACVRAKLF